MTGPGIFSNGGGFWLSFTFHAMSFPTSRKNFCHFYFSDLFIYVYSVFFKGLYCFRVVLGLQQNGEESTELFHIPPALTQAITCIYVYSSIISGQCTHTPMKPPPQPRYRTFPSLS